jgi:hypothetical protein
VYVRCVSTGPRVFLFHVAYSINTSVDGQEIDCNCHKVRGQEHSGRLLPPTHLVQAPPTQYTRFRLLPQPRGEMTSQTLSDTVSDSKVKTPLQ